MTSSSMPTVRTKYPRLQKLFCMIFRFLFPNLLWRRMALFPLRIESHGICYAVFGWDGDYHVDMIDSLSVPFDNLYPFSFCQCSDYGSYFFSGVKIENLFSILGDDHDMVSTIPRTCSCVLSIFIRILAPYGAFLIDE